MSTEIFLGAVLAMVVYFHHGYDFTITSIRDGEHMRGSKHYTGHAIDIRTRNVPKQMRERVRDEIRSVLGEDYDVILEKDHLHIEYDPEIYERPDSRHRYTPTD